MNYQYIPSFTYNTNYYDPLTSYNSQGLSSTTPTATYNPSFLTTPSPSLSLSSFTTSPSPSNQTTNGLYSTQTLFPQHMGLTTAFPNNLSAPPVNHTAYTGLSSLNPTPTSANYNSFFNPPTPVSSTTSFYSPSSYSLQSSLNTTPTNQSTYYNNLTPSIRSPSFTWPRLRTRSIRSNSFSNNFNNNSFDLTNYQMNGIGMGSNTILLLTLLPEHANLNTRYEPTAEEIQDNMQSKLGRLIDEIDENGNNNYDFNSQKHILLPTVEEVESLFRPYGEVKKIIIFNKVRQ